MPLSACHKGSMFDLRQKSSNDFHEVLVQMGDLHLNLALLLAWLGKFAPLALTDQHITSLSLAL